MSRRARLIYALVLSCVALAACAWSTRAVWSFTIDDAGISYAYAKHIAEGLGAVAAPGAPAVEGYSNALWVLALVPFHWLGLDVPVVAKVLGVILLGAAVVLAARLRGAVRGGADQWPSAADLLFGVGLGTCLEFVVWIVAGLENALFSALLVGLVVLHSREEANAARLGWSGLCAFALSITRPEGALYVAPLALLTLWRLVRPDRRRQAASTAALFLGPFVVYHAVHYAVFRQWLPNTYLAKPPGKDWHDGYEYLESVLRESGLVYAAPLALLGLLGNLRRAWLLAYQLAAGAAFILYAGGDWMPHGRFVALLAAPLGVLTIVGADTLSGLLARLARGRLGREWIALGLTVLALVPWVRHQEPRLAQVKRQRWCHFCERLRATDRVRQLGARALLPSAALITQDFGGPAWRADERLYPLDFLGLCDRSVALIRDDRKRRGGSIGSDARLYQYLLHEQASPPSWLALPRNFWPNLDGSPEFREGYFRLDPRLVPYSRRDSYFGLHRAELVDYFAPIGRFEFAPLDEQLTLVGAAVVAPWSPSAVTPGALAAGSRVTVVASVLPRGRVLGHPELTVRIESAAGEGVGEPVPLARGLEAVAEQLDAGDPLSFEWTLELPPEPAPEYRVALGVRRSGGAAAGTAAGGSGADVAWTAVASLAAGAPLAPYERRAPRFPTALPAARDPELVARRTRVLAATERQRRAGVLEGADAALAAELSSLAAALEARQSLDQAYLAYVWATHADRRAWRDAADPVHRLRAALDDGFATELALLRRYYGSASAATLRPLIAFYRSLGRSSEADYFGERGGLDARDLAPAAGPGGAPVDEARDPLGGALDFETAALDGWEGQRDVWRAGPWPEKYAAIGARGHHGSGLLSSLARGERGRGTLTSPEFRLEGTLLSVLVGGGRERKEVNVELLVEGQVVKAARGNGSSFMVPVLWDISAHAGKLARLRVVDRSKAAHIMVDRVRLWR